MVVALAERQGRARREQRSAVAAQARDAAEPPAGAPLDDHSYDDNWSDLQWQNGMVEVRVVDPKAHYGVAIDGISPEIKTIQLYSPPTAKFVAVEDQYNFADPFGKEWHGMNTGMVTLKPGESTKWHMRLRVFVP